MMNLFGDKNEGGKVEEKKEDPLVGNNDPQITPEEKERREKAQNEKLDEKVDEKVKEDKKKNAIKKKKERTNNTIRLVIPPEEWEKLPDPISKEQLKQFSSSQKTMNLNISKLSNEAKNKATAALTAATAGTNKLLGTDSESKGVAPPAGNATTGESKPWYKFWGGRKRRRRKRTRKRSKRRKKKSRRKTKRRR